MEKVWVADGTEGFLLGRIVDIGDEGPVVQPFDNRPPVVATYDRLWPAEEEDGKEVDDNCGLMYLNEATLLNNVKLRYAKDKIYTVCFSAHGFIVCRLIPAILVAVRGKYPLIR